MKQKVTIRRIISNICFVNKLILQSSRTILIITLISRIFDTIIGFFNGVIIIRLLLNMLSISKPFSEVLKVILIGIGINTAKILYDSILSGFYTDKETTKITKDAFRMVYEKSCKVKYSSFYKTDFYNSMSFALSKIANTIWEVLGAIASFVGSIISFALNINMILLTNNQYDSYILLVTMLISSLIVQFIQFKINKMTLQLGLDIRLTERKRDYSRKMFYKKDFAKDIKCTDISRIFYKNFIENNDSITSKLINFGNQMTFIQGISSIVRSVPINIGVLIYLAYRLIVLRNINIGDLWGVYKGCNFIISTNVFSILSSIHKNALNIEKIREFLEIEEEDEISGIVLLEEMNVYDIEFVNVSFRYDLSEKYALRNINMKIKTGERIALVGHNGAGKTTLTLLLLRLYEPTEGKILLNGRDIREYNLLSYRRLIGQTFQDYKIYPYSIAENVLMDKRSNVLDYQENVSNSLKKCDIYNRINAHENNIDSLVSKEFVKDGIVLSGGEQQRLAISRLFSKRSRILILDEPSSSLDPISEADINRRIIEYSNGKTTIVVTHRLSTVKDVNTIYLLDKGMIVESGSHQNLLKLNGKYASLFNTQAKYYINEGFAGVCYQQEAQ